MNRKKINVVGIIASVKVWTKTILCYFSCMVNAIKKTNIFTIKFFGHSASQKKCSKSDHKVA